MFLPPPEALIARHLAVTLAAISWYISAVDDAPRCMGLGATCNCRIMQGFDNASGAEYVEVECEDVCSIDTALPKIWGMKASSMTQASWDTVTLAYDEATQRYIWKAGKFVSGGFVKAAQDRVVTNPLRYFYARGFAVEPRQSQQPRKSGKGSPKPASGFIDLLLGNLSPFIFALESLRRSTLYPSRQARQVLQQAGRSHNVLLADLGDGSVGLREAVKMLFNPGFDDKCNLRISTLVYNIPGLNRPSEFVTCFGDVAGWLARLLVVEVLHRLTEESIELLQRWPSIVIVSYGSRGDVEDTRLAETTIIGGEDLVLAYHSVAAAAAEIGLRIHKLLSMLRWLPGCIVEALRKGVMEENTARGIASKLTPLYDSILQGRVDRDILYSVVRSLSSITGIQDLHPCRRVLHALGGG